MSLLCILSIFIISLIISVFLIFNPTSAIEMQRKFYEKINWRIEPISMQKEIRNTRIMGAFLFIISLLAFVYLSFGRLGR
jgi:hypothetical protein